MNKQQLANKIWESANKMRSKIEANEYKDYILGFIFYKFLSDKEVDFLKKDGYEEADLQEHVHENNEELVDYCQQHLGYFIAYDNLFSTWLDKGNSFTVGTIRRDESERALQYDKASLSNYKVVNEGDLIVHLRSFEGGLEKANSQGIISPAYHTFHGEGVDSRFYYTYFRSKNFIDTDLKPHVYGIRDGRSIDIEGMKTIEIPFTSYPEQKLIGDAIDSINTLISLQRRELEKLQSIKKALLEKMFV